MCVIVEYIVDVSSHGGEHILSEFEHVNDVLELEKNIYLIFCSYNVGKCSNAQALWFIQLESQQWARDLCKGQTCPSCMICSFYIIVTRYWRQLAVEELWWEKSMQIDFLLDSEYWCNQIISLTCKRLCGRVAQLWSFFLLSTSGSELRFIL